MDNADEKKKDKKKGGFTWVSDILHSGLSDEERNWSALSDEAPDWDDDRYDPSAQACQTAHHSATFWSDYAGSMEMDEPQREMYEDGLKINEDTKSDVDILADEINQLKETIKEEFKIDREPIPLLKRIISSILDDIPVTIFWLLVGGLITLILSRAGGG